MAMVLEEKLAGILTANEVPKPVMEWMRDNGCHSLKLFANWVDSGEELRPELLSKVGDEADRNPSTFAALKQAWREAEAQVQRTLQRGAQGLPAEKEDDPLDENVQEAMDKAFTAYYKWELGPHRRLDDSAVGRFKREADKWMPKLFSASSARSLAQANRTSAVKRHKVSDSLAFETEEASLQHESDDGTLRRRLSQYELIGNTWGLTGCVGVTCEGKTIKYCHWQLAGQHINSLRMRTEHLLDKFTEDSVVQYLTTCEEHIRGYAIEATRS